MPMVEGISFPSRGCLRQSRTDTRPLVTTEEQRVLPLVRQRTDESFRKIVVNGVFAVVTASEHLRPEVVDIYVLECFRISSDRTGFFIR